MKKFIFIITIIAIALVLPCYLLAQQTQGTPTQVKLDPENYDSYSFTSALIRISSFDQDFDLETFLKSNIVANKIVGENKVVLMFIDSFRKAFQSLMNFSMTIAFLFLATIGFSRIFSIGYSTYRQTQTGGGDFTEIFVARFKGLFIKMAVATSLFVLPISSGSTYEGYTPLMAQATRTVISLGDRLALSIYNEVTEAITEGMFQTVVDSFSTKRKELEEQVAKSRKIREETYQAYKNLVEGSLLSRIQDANTISEIQTAMNSGAVERMRGVCEVFERNSQNQITCKSLVEQYAQASFSEVQATESLEQINKQINQGDFGEIKKEVQDIAKDLGWGGGVVTYAGSIMKLAEKYSDVTYLSYNYAKDYSTSSSIAGSSEASKQLAERLERGSLEKVLSTAIVYLSLPPGSMIFGFLKTIMVDGDSLVMTMVDKGLNALISAISAVLLVTLTPAGGIIASAVLYIVKTSLMLFLKAGAAVLAVIAAYFITVFLMSILPLLALTLAISLRLISFLVEITKFMLIIPFYAPLVILGQGEDRQYARAFIVQMLYFAVYPALIVIATVFGLFMWTLVNIASFGLMAIGFVGIVEYKTSIAVGVLATLMISLAHYLASIFGSALLFKFVFNFPESAVQQLGLRIEHATTQIVSTVEHKMPIKLPGL